MGISGHDDRKPRRCTQGEKSEIGGDGSKVRGASRALRGRTAKCCLRNQEDMQMLCSSTGSTELIIPEMVVTNELRFVNKNTGY